MIPKKQEGGPQEKQSPEKRPLIKTDADPEETSGIPLDDPDMLPDDEGMFETPPYEDAEPGEGP